MHGCIGGLVPKICRTTKLNFNLLKPQDFLSQITFKPVHASTSPSQLLCRDEQYMSDPCGTVMQNSSADGSCCEKSKKGIDA